MTYDFTVTSFFQLLLPAHAVKNSKLSGVGRADGFVASASTTGMSAADLPAARA